MDDVRWEDEIDLDDSDLCNTTSLSFLRPCSQSQTRRGKSPSPPPRPEKDPPVVPLRRLIPGPAGAVQTAMHRQTLAFSSSSEKGDCAGGFGVVDDDIDDDFNLSPWLSALDFIGFGTCSLQKHNPIISFKYRRSPIRLEQVLGIVNSCRPNGSGGFFITLKDPTGKIDASVHHTVLNDRGFGNGELAVGCVLVLKQVVLFPIRETCYLNITLHNMVKLFTKDCEPPHVSSLSRYIAYGKGDEVRPGVAVRRECTQVVEKFVTNGSQKLVALDSDAADNETLAQQVPVQTVKDDSSRNMIKRVKVGGYPEGHIRDSRFTYSSSNATICSQLEEERSTSMTLEAEGISDGNTIIDPNRTDKVCSERREGLSIRTYTPLDRAQRMTQNKMPRTSNDIEKDCADGVTKVSNTRTEDGRSLKGSSASLPTSSPFEPATTLPTKSEPKVIISKASVTEWTDEQISELLSDYSDADEMNKFLL